MLPNIHHHSSSNRGAACRTRAFTGCFQRSIRRRRTPKILATPILLNCHGTYDSQRVAQVPTAAYINERRPQFTVGSRQDSAEFLRPSVQPDISKPTTGRLVRCMKEKWQCSELFAYTWCGPSSMKKKRHAKIGRSKLCVEHRLPGHIVKCCLDYL